MGATHEGLTSECDLVFDAEGTLTRYGGSTELLVDMIGFFLEDAPPLVADLHRAAAAGDALAVRHTAHALKGLLAGCGGKRAAHAAQRVENAGAAAHLEDVDVSLNALEKQIEFLREAVTAYRP
jgi:HPt (histidine-containing phosphotransfer) domain-containing protein